MSVLLYNQMRVESVSQIGWLVPVDPDEVEEIPGPFSAPCERQRREAAPHGHLSSSEAHRMV